MNLIPEMLDYVGLFDDLNKLHMCDAVIERQCELAPGHVAHMRAGRWQDMTYRRAAKVFNLWLLRTGKGK